MVSSQLKQKKKEFFFVCLWVCAYVWKFNKEKGKLNSVFGVNFFCRFSLFFILQCLKGLLMSSLFNCFVFKVATYFLFFCLLLNFLFNTTMYCMWYNSKLLFTYMNIVVITCKLIEHYYWALFRLVIVVINIVIVVFLVKYITFHVCMGTYVCSLC